MSGEKNVQVNYPCGAEPQDCDTETNGCESTGSDESNCNGQAKRCPICLESFKTQRLGVLEQCDHTFCIKCIEKWAETINICPLDRKIFNSVKVCSHDGKFVKSVNINQSPDSALSVIACSVCGHLRYGDRLVFCDECNFSCHLGCLNPPRDEQPHGDFPCPNCGGWGILNVDTAMSQ